MIRGDVVEESVFARAAALVRAPPYRLRRRCRPAVRRPAARRRPRSAQTAAPDVRGGRLGAGRIGARRSAGRSALALRIGRGDDRAARRDSPSARRRPPRPTCVAAVREQQIRALPGLDAERRGGDRARRCRRCAPRIPRVPLGRAVGHRRNRCSIGCAACPAWSGRRRSDRCAAGRTWSATSRSSPPPSQPADAIADTARRARHRRACCTRPSGGCIC